MRSLAGELGRGSCRGRRSSQARRTRTWRDWLAQVEDVARPLREGVPEDERDRPWTAEERGQRLLADLLGWHRREQKPEWWRYFHQLQDMTDEERLEAKEPVAVLELIGPDGRFGQTLPLPLPRAGPRS